MIGDDFQTSGGDDDARNLGDDEDFVGRRVLPPPVFLQPRDGEDLEGSAEVENLDLGEDQDADRDGVSSINLMDGPQIRSGRFSVRPSRKSPVLS